MTEFPETQSLLLANIQAIENREAWEEFVVLYRPVIYRMARRRGMQDSDAQDLTQDVLLRIARSIETWESRPDIRFRHWLRKVANNAILTALTKSNRQPVVGAIADHLLEETPEAQKVEVPEWVESSEDKVSFVNVETRKQLGQRICENLRQLNGACPEDTAQYLNELQGLYSALKPRLNSTESSYQVYDQIAIAAWPIAVRGCPLTRNGDASEFYKALVELTRPLNRQFHVATKRCGSKQIESGTMPVTPTGRVPRISRLLALAHHCYRLVQSGAIINQSELAHFGQISTTRMTQIMWLDNLAPDIQEEILFLPRTTQGRDPIKEADIRPIAKTLDWNKQRQMWRELKMAIRLSG